MNTIKSTAADVGATVRAVRHSLSCALANPAFGLACVARVLDGLDPGYNGWRYPKIHRDPDRGYSVCVFSWTPGLVNAPHRHDTWTVTGVLHNSLRFNTFRVAPDGAALIPEKRVDAKPGGGGYICTPCIHNVENPTSAPALSIHIFNHSQIAGSAAELVEYRMAGTVSQSRDVAPAAPDGAVREDLLAACAGMIGAHAHARNLPLLDRVLTLAEGKAKLPAIKAMAGIDPLHAAERARALAERMAGRVGDRLREASEAILQHA